MSSPEPTSPSSSASSPNPRNESPTRHTPEWNGDGTPNRDNSTQSTPRSTPTQQQNQHNIRNMPPASSLRERRVVRGIDEQNGNQNMNGRVERGLNNGQPRRPNRNRNRNNLMPSCDRRTDPPQPTDLPRGYGLFQLINDNNS